ncbi:MAG TPA: metalloregulator ArsR/SmtB family transcription factor [Aggregatilineaceae bacterium]|nr:metalloregulator ArsR/SmtB family transcription factor [Aggregatilineaceae bacterium]
MDQATRQEIEILHQQVCTALADPTRIMLFFILAQEPKCVGDLATELGIPQPSISRHLKILRERSLVKATRKGALVYYSLTDMRVLQALELMRGVLRDRVLKQARLVRDGETEELVHSVP